MKTTRNDPSQKPLNHATKLGRQSGRHWLLAGLGLLLSSGALQADDTLATAIAIQPGDIAGAISPLNDLDYFSFTISSAQVVTLATKASAVGIPATTLDLRLYDSIGGYIASSGSTRTNAPSIALMLQPGTYYVRGATAWNNTGAYRLVLKTQSSAIPITKVINGNFDVANDWQTYKFTILSPGYVELWQINPQVSTPLINLNITLRNEAGTFLDSGAFGGLLNPGNYFITVNSDTNEPNTGDFSLKLLTPDNATAIKDETISGTIDVPHDQDHFRFVVAGNAPRTIRFLISGTVFLDTFLQNEFGQFLKMAANTSQDDGIDIEMSINPGVYFFYLYGSNSSGVGSFGNYTLNLSGLMPAVPEISVQQPSRSELVDAKSKRSFGTAVVGTKKAITKTFVIRNLGGATLKGLRISASGANAGDFKITAQPSSSLTAGKQTTFKVSFMPKSKGARSAWLRISSNDKDENPFDIPLSGKAVGK